MRVTPILLWLGLSMLAGCTLSHRAVGDASDVRTDVVVDARSEDSSDEFDVPPQDGDVLDVNDVVDVADVLDVADAVDVPLEDAAPDDGQIDVFDVPDAPPIDAPPVDAADISTDTPMDVPPTCGAAGQACCAGLTCSDPSLGCRDWGGGVQLCVPCGSLGNLCCPGDNCSVGSCLYVQGGALPICTRLALTDAPGGSCATVGGSCGTSPPTLACFTGPSSGGVCASCGGAGQICCYGLYCGSGLACTTLPNGGGLCR